MRKYISIVSLLLILSICVFGQSKKAENFGFKHLNISFNKDSVDILIKYKSGDEMKSKPLFFFCQGSLPIPLIITEGKDVYPSFPFDTKIIIEKFHLVIVGKPGIPLITNTKELEPDFSYLERNSHQPPIKYSKYNYLEYYVNRNLHIIDYLTQQKFINSSNLVVAGHSQGARVAFEMALKSNKITHLIYANGNPSGQIMSMVTKSRQREISGDTIPIADNDFKHYESVVSDSSNVDLTYGDSNKSIYSFSKSSINTFPKLKIPVLICYGTNDPSTPFNDYLHAEIIRQRKKNFTFQTYIGLEHNFFGLKQSGEIDYDNFNWDKVVNDWLKWLKFR